MTKKELRKYYLNKRKNLSEKDYHEKNMQITDNLFSSFEFKSIRSIHIFLPILKNHEVNTTLIIQKLKEGYPEIKIIISKSNLENYEMTHYVWDKDTQLQENKWGIPEPESGILFLEKDLDMILVPLVIFDKEGHRVGYGKGFYDRFLSKCPKKTVKVGLSIEEPVEVISDTHENDFKLNYCITPDKVYNFTNN